MDEEKVKRQAKKDQKKREATLAKEMRKKTFFGFGKHYDPTDPRIMVMVKMPDGSERRGINFGHPKAGRLLYVFILVLIGLGFWLSFRV